MDTIVRVTAEHAYQLGLYRAYVPWYDVADDDHLAVTRAYGDGMRAGGHWPQHPPRQGPRNKRTAKPTRNQIMARYRDE